MTQRTRRPASSIGRVLPAQARVSSETATILAVGADTVDVRLSGGEVYRHVPAAGGVGGIKAGDTITVQWADAGDRRRAPVAIGGAPTSAGGGGGVIVGGEGGGSVPDPHALSSTHHSGTLADSQAPQFLKADGSRDLTGNLGVDAAVTIDGVDIDEFEDEMVTTMVRVRDLDLELMKMSFTYISWSQHAVYEAFDDEDKRLVGDPSTYKARVYRGRIDNGGDATPDRSFGFYSKLYEDITTVWTGVADSVGADYLEDAAGEWFDDQYKGYVLVDSAASEFAILSCTESPRRLLVASAPASGVYSIRTVDPAYMVAFCSYSDSTGDGNGYVKLEVTFDGGSNWQTVLDTEGGVDLLGGTLAISDPGRDYQFRATLKNDGSGNGAVIHKLLICTDPSVWQ